jgi:hypothetical protein
VQGQPGLAAQVLEGDGGPKLHRLDVFCAAVPIDDALGPHDLLEDDAVW